MRDQKDSIPNILKGKAPMCTVLHISLSTASFQKLSYIMFDSNDVWNFNSGKRKISIILGDT